MSQTRWQQIEEIFQSALDLSPAERSNFVSMRCAHDAELKREIEKLISDYESAESFIESPVWTNSDFLNSTAKRNIASSLEETELVDAGANEHSMIGRQIGAYRLTREIGRGGMGAVYAAERADGSFRQQVAVKLIKRGMDTDFILKRFRQERQILASLNHSFIARLLDGGTTADGLPYFVMEFIEGEPLYKYADEKKLNITERLKLFRQICQAIDFAHQNQVIHRDIKPPNILITSGGTPKLLDFGIAKVLNPELGVDTIDTTATAMRLMTPEYASPEQVCGGEITPASDIYSLGVLLYELLTGHRPYRFRNRAPHEIARVICDEEPDRPSTSIPREDNLLPAGASQATTVLEVCLFRGAANVAELQKELSGDIEKIILKSLRKNPSERYQKTAELAEDITCYLNGKPVVAEIVSTKLAQKAHIKPTGEKSLAVLPLRVLSPALTSDTGEEYLSVGLADAMITRLSGIRRLIVRPTSAVLRYGDAEDLFVAGRELNVDFVLYGSIRRAGSRIRISAQLIDIKQNSTSWAQNFDADFTEVLEIEDSISERVTESLLPFLTGEEKQRLKKRGTDKPRAYESFLRGRYHFNSFTEEGFAKSIVAFHEAIAHDPNYALAFAGIADYYNWLAVFGVLPAQECFQSAIEAATKAVELDPELSDAHAALGFAAVGGQYDWAQGEISCRRALELNHNNSTAHVWYSIQLFMEGRFEDGFRHARRGIEIDPLSPFNRHNLGWGLYFARRFEESIEQYRLLIKQTDGQYPLGFYGLSWGLRLTGQFDEAVRASEQALELDKESTFLLAGTGQSLAAAGKREEAEEVLTKLEQLSERRSVSAYHIAVIHTFLGDTEKALAALEKSYENHEAWIAWTGVEPVFDSLRRDERFINLFERTGNPLTNRINTLKPDKNAEITVESLIQTTDADGGEIPSVKRNSEPVSTYRFPKWAIAAAFVGLVCTVFLAAHFGWKNSSQPDNESVFGQKTVVNSLTKKPGDAISIAVLPFVRTDAKTDDEQYLGVGTADLVTSKLGQISEINLRSANSVRRYLKTDKSPLEIGRELAVDYVVGGTIERRENAVEAKLEMTEIQSGRVVWSEIFDEPNSDLFALQDSISETVVKSLSLRLTNAEKQNLARHFTENNKAQQLYVAGRYHFGKRTVEGLKEAITLFEQAIATDPNFALAYTGLADCQALLNWYQEPQPPNAWSNAKTAAEKAVALDDNLAEAHASLAFIKFHFERDYRGSEDEFRRAVNLKPNYATAHQWYAFLLSAQARHTEAIAVMRRAEELEPRSAVITNAVANVLFLARLYDESIEQAKRSLEIDPSSVGAHVILRWNYEMKAATDEALAIYEKEIAIAGETPTSRAKQAHVFAAAGKKDEARKILGELAKNNQIEQITPYEIAVIYALLNDKDKSLEYLIKARDVHAVGFSFVRVDPLLDNLRGDKRFENLLK